MNTTVDQAERKLEQVRQRVAGQVRELRAELDQLGDDAMHETRRAVRRGDRALHDHPYTAMAVAAAAGLLIGLLSARRF